jgi:hypothetical protein
LEDWNLKKAPNLLKIVPHLPITKAKGPMIIELMASIFLVGLALVLRFSNVYLHVHYFSNVNASIVLVSHIYALLSGFWKR